MCVPPTCSLLAWYDDADSDGGARATVAEKLKQEGRAELSHAETTEELEDEEGNVYNRKTYEDLKRQGLV